MKNDTDVPIWMVDDWISDFFSKAPFSVRRSVKAFWKQTRRTIKTSGATHLKTYGSDHGVTVSGAWF